MKKLWWGSFDLLYALARFGLRHERQMDDFAWEDWDEALGEAQGQAPDNNIADLRKRQEVLLSSIAETLREVQINPYHELIDRLKRPQKSER